MATLIENAFTKIFGNIGSFSQGIYSRIFEDFKPYIEECFQKNRNVRILCRNDDDVDLFEVYVETFFSNNNKNISDVELISDIGSEKNHIIVGTGGAGKTFFMRKMWLDLFKEGHRTPLFIELRNASNDLNDFIRTRISNKLSKELYERFCLEGRFVFILDGFDEIPKDQHEDIQHQILRMSEKYPKCAIVVSGRHDERFVGWAGFRVFEVKPFTLKQTRTLCNKVPFDSKYKKAFLNVLNKNFYNRYESFLSNPLLSIMMMMVFKQNMNIAQKMGIFYDDAFVTLYQRHDATKAFKRPKHLDIQQFRRSFGTFCLLSYIKEKFDFSQTELDELVEKSSKFIGLDVSKENIIDDYERNVNLIRQEGLRYYFIHRSFQEYFAAWAIINVFSHKIDVFLNALESRPGDNVLAMCYDLNKSLIIKEYIAKRFREMSEIFPLEREINLNDIWMTIVPKATLYILSPWEEILKNRSTVSISYQSGIDRPLANFMNNLYLMIDKSSDIRKSWEVVDPFFYSEIFSDGTRWIAEADISELDFKVEVFDINLEDLCLNLKIIKREEGSRKTNEDDYRIIKILITPEEAGRLRSAAQRVADTLNQAIIWCKELMVHLEENDREVDKLFLSLDSI